MLFYENLMAYEKVSTSVIYKYTIYFILLTWVVKMKIINLDNKDDYIKNAINNFSFDTLYLKEEGNFYYTLYNGIRIFSINQSIDEDVTFQLKGVTKYISLITVLNGHYHLIKKNEKTIKCDMGECIVCCSQNISGAYIIPKQENFRRVSIQIPADIFRKMCGDDVLEIIEMIKEENAAFHNLKLHSTILSSFERISKPIYTLNYEKISVMSTVYQIIFEIIKTFENKKHTFTDNNYKKIILGNKDIKKIKQISLYLQKELRHVRLNDLSIEFNINKLKLKAGFHQIYGDTVFQYGLRCRLKKSIDLLLNSNMKISDIAYEIGYSKPYTFTSNFKKEHKQTPIEYRRNHKNL